MKGKFCPKCGKSNKSFYDGFCVECYINDHPEVMGIDELSLKQCPRCLRVFSRGEWESGRPENMEEIISSHVKTSLDNPKVHVELIEGNNKREIYEITVTGTMGGEEVSLTRETQLRYVKDMCVVCSRKSGNYYEAIIQLRPKEKAADLDKLKSAIVFLRNEARALTKKDRQAEIFRFELVKHGIDVYFGSARVAKIALQHLNSTYNPVVKESYTLRGVNKETGKKRYSVTYSVRV